MNCGINKTAVFTCVIWPSLVMAQSEDRVIEEVVVTATKRAQSAQDVPIAISAFDDEMIEDHDIVSIKNLESLTPGLNIAQSDASRTRVRIRGIGSRKFDVGSEGSVGVFVDEIYMPRFSGIEFTLLDLERIEVLKGPQGTLFGRNTTGGAVSLISKGPEASRYCPRTGPERFGENRLW